MTSLIVDASVALKWVIEENGSAEAEALAARDVDLVAPDLICAELANALWKKSRRDEIDGALAYQALAAALDTFSDLTPILPLSLRAAELARTLDHPACDCFYLALAEARGATLVTADSRLLMRLRDAGWPGQAAAL